MAVDPSLQRIARLTPLGAILALIDARVAAVQPSKCPLASARGQTLAEDVVVARLPSVPIALRDGFAVEAGAMADAGPYSPLPLASKPPRVDAGDALPDGTDAVAPFDAIDERGGRAEAVAPIAPGEGVLPAGGDAVPERPLRRAGERLRAIDAAILAAAGIAEVAIHAPRISIVRGGGATSPVIEAARGILSSAAVDCGGVAFGKAMILQASLDYEQPDAVIVVGGTGSGRRDASVQTLAKYGRVEAHGIAVSPGETAAFGFVGSRPYLLVPGRLDAALAVWLLIGRHLVAKLAGGSVVDVPIVLPLKRKVTSTIGLTELVPVSCIGGVAEPLGCGYLSLQALAGSDGWIAVPADSEGFAAGTPVAVRPWP